MRSTWTTRVVFMIGGLLFTGSAAVAVQRSSLSTPTDLTDSRAFRSVEAHTPARPEAAAPGVLFTDDFEDDPMGADPPKGWTIADGRWNGVISNDTHVVQHAVGPFGQMVAGSRGWTDYTVSAAVMPTPLKNGFAAVAGRYLGPGDYYQCDIHHASWLQLWRLRGGVATLLDSRPAAINPTHFSSLRLVMTGDRLTCTLNGALVCSAVDASFTHGAVALIAGASEAAEFDNVMVTADPRNQHWSAVTSHANSPGMKGGSRAASGLGDPAPAGQTPGGRPTDSSGGSGSGGYPQHASSHSSPPRS